MAASASSVVKDLPSTSQELLAIPNEFLCAITLEVMHTPVLAADGHTYEREAIEEWLNGHRTSPKTGLTLTPNIALRQAIETYTRTMPEIQQRDIQRRQEAMNLQAIISLREAEAAHKQATAELEKTELVRIITGLEERLQIEIRAREQVEQELMEERTKNAPLVQKLEEILTAEQEKIAVEQEKVRKLTSLRDSMLQTSMLGASQMRGQRPLGTPAAASTSLLPQFSRVAAAASVPQPSTPEVNPAQLQAFLNQVVAGQQDEAEALLKQTPILALGAGTVTDHAKPHLL